MKDIKRFIDVIVSLFSEIFNTFFKDDEDEEKEKQEKNKKEE